jgi:hypothetical protein
MSREHDRIEENEAAGAKMWVGIFFIFASVAASIVFVRGNMGDRLYTGAAPGPLWWGLVSAFVLFFSIGVVWTVTGLRMFLPPTTLLYRILDFSRWWRT